MSPRIGDKKQLSNMNPVYLVSLSFNFSVYEMGIKYEPHRLLEEKSDNLYKMLTRRQASCIQYDKHGHVAMVTGLFTNLWVALMGM